MNEIIIPNTGAVINTAEIASMRTDLEKAISDFSTVGEVTADNAERAVLAKKVLGGKIKKCEDARRATDRAIDALLVDNVPGLAESRSLIEVEREAKKLRDKIDEGIKALEPKKPRTFYIATFYANDAELAAFQSKAEGKFNPRTGKKDPEMVGGFKFWNLDAKQADKIYELINKWHSNDILV